jgi:hypothetical protein
VVVAAGVHVLSPGQKVTVFQGKVSDAAAQKTAQKNEPNKASARMESAPSAPKIIVAQSPVQQ